MHMTISTYYPSINFTGNLQEEGHAHPLLSD